MNFIYIASHQNLLNSLQTTLIQPHALVIPYNLINNLGLELLKAIITKYNISNIPVIINCNKNLAYTIYAVEKNFPYILFSHENLSIFNNMYELATLHKVILFNNEKNMFEYFKNHYYNT